METAQEEMNHMREEMRSVMTCLMTVLKDTSGDMREMARIALRAAMRLDETVLRVEGEGQRRGEEGMEG